MKHHRRHIFAVAFTTSARTDLARAGQGARRPISIPALIPAFCRAGAGFSETSRAPIASIGAGFRGVVGCREPHLGLVDHQEHAGSHPFDFTECSEEHPDSDPALTPASCGAGKAGAVAGWGLKAGSRRRPPGAWMLSGGWLAPTPTRARCSDRKAHRHAAHYGCDRGGHFGPRSSCGPHPPLRFRDAGALGFLGGPWAWLSVRRTQSISRSRSISSPAAERRAAVLAVEHALRPARACRGAARRCAPRSSPAVTSR